MAEIKGNKISDVFAGIGTMDDSSPPSGNEALLTDISWTYIKQYRRLPGLIKQILKSASDIEQFPLLSNKSAEHSIIYMTI